MKGNFGLEDLFGDGQASVVKVVKGWRWQWRKNVMTGPNTRDYDEL